MAEDDGYFSKSFGNAKESVQRRMPKWTGMGFKPKDSDRKGDPLPTFSFLVDLDFNAGQSVAQLLFKSVSGLQYSTQVIPVGSGGTNHTTYKLVGHTEWPNLVLKQGFTNQSSILEWRESWMYPGKAGGKKRRARFHGAITLLDTSLQPKAVWEFERGWPCKWDISEFDASKSEIAIETLEIAHDGLTYSLPKKLGDASFEGLGTWTKTKEQEAAEKIPQKPTGETYNDLAKQGGGSVL